MSFLLITDLVEVLRTFFVKYRGGGGVSEILLISNNIII